MCVCVCVCVCVRERERVRERENVASCHIHSTHVDTIHTIQCCYVRHQLCSGTIMNTTVHVQLIYWTDYLDLVLLTTVGLNDASGHLVLMRRGGGGAGFPIRVAPQPLSQALCANNNEINGPLVGDFATDVWVVFLAECRD